MVKEPDLWVCQILSLIRWAVTSRFQTTVGRASKRGNFFSNSPLPLEGLLFSLKSNSHLISLMVSLHYSVFHFKVKNKMHFTCHVFLYFTYFCHTSENVTSILFAHWSQLLWTLGLPDQKGPVTREGAADAAAKLLQSCLTLRDPIHGSPPGSPVPGILQARTLEWVAISFSNVWKWKVKVKLLSRVRLFTIP